MGLNTNNCKSVQSAERGTRHVFVKQECPKVALSHPQGHVMLGSVRNPKMNLKSKFGT